MALHSITCETCRSGDLCAAEPYLVAVLGNDPSAELRHKARTPEAVDLGEEP